MKFMGPGFFSVVYCPVFAHLFYFCFISILSDQIALWVSVHGRDCHLKLALFFICMVFFFLHSLIS